MAHERKETTIQELRSFGLIVGESFYQFSACLSRSGKTGIGIRGFLP